MSTSAATHGDAGSQELLAERAPMNAQLGTNLTQRPTLGDMSAARLTFTGPP
jgi:hypothetical protein